MTRVGTVAAVVREVFTEAREQEITFLAAGIAYYAFASLLPMLLLALAVASFVGGERFAMNVVEAAQNVLTPSASDVLRDALTGAAGRSGATIVGTLVLLWSTLKVFRGLDESFSRVYDVERDVSIVEQLRDGVTVLAAIGVAVVAMVVTGAVLTAFPTVPFIGVLSTLALLLALVPVFLPIYYVFPDTDVSLAEVLPGVILATVSWTILQVVFRIYASNAGRFEAYGVLGGALLLVTWFYFGGIVLLLGAVVNVVLAERGSYARRKREEKDSRKSLERRKNEIKSELHMTDETDSSAPDVLELRDQVRELEAEVDAFEESVESRTVDKPKLETELKRYVRKRMRAGHARDWGPYLVLLYGTAMTIGAFYFLRGGWSILAMFVVWLSTLGLYVVMLFVGFGISAVGLPGRVGDRIRSWRS